MQGFVTSIWKEEARVRKFYFPRSVASLGKREGYFGPPLAGPRLGFGAAPSLGPEPTPGETLTLPEPKPPEP